MQTSQVEIKTCQEKVSPLRSISGIVVILKKKILLIAFLVHYWDLRAARNRLLGYFSKSDQPTLLRNNCCINAMRLCAMLDIYTKGNKWLIQEE